MERLLTRAGVILPPKAFCSGCLRPMHAEPDRQEDVLISEEETRRYIKAEDWQGYRERVATAAVFVTFGLRYTCAACGNSHSSYSHKYTEEEVGVAVSWQNTEEYRSPEEQAWAERHRPLPGYEERAVAALLMAFPEWQEYLTTKHKKGTTYPLFVVPDPVPERCRDLEVHIGEPVHFEMLLECRGTHTHFSFDPRDNETWHEAESRHFDGTIEMIQTLLSDNVVMYSVFERGRFGAGGSWQLAEGEPMYPFHAFPNANLILYWSWLGTHDRAVAGVSP